MNASTAISQADGYADVTRKDLALGICGVVAAAQQLGMSQLAFLHHAADTWDDMAAQSADDRHAADRITG